MPSKCLERRQEGTKGGSSEEAKGQCFPAHTWQCQEGESGKEMDIIYSMHQVWLTLVPAFNFKIAKECYYPLSALTANLSLASGASNGSIIREHTGKEPRAGKLPSDECLPPPSLCGLSTVGEAARAGGEGLFHDLM